jgi:hypothetical protein
MRPRVRSKGPTPVPEPVPEAVAVAATGASPSVPAPVAVRRYDDGSAEASAVRFQADAADAARAGYLPASQVWEGSALIVTYQRAATTEAVDGPAPRQRVGVPSLAIGIGGVLVAIGSILPWVRLGTVSTGSEGTGLIMAVLGVALVLIGFAGLTDPARARQLRSLAILGGLATFVIAVVDLWNVSFEVTAAPGRPSAIGEGLWVSLAGAVVALAGALRSVGAPDPTAHAGARRRNAIAIWLVLGIIALVAIGLLIAISGPR